MATSKKTTTRKPASRKPAGARATTKRPAKARPASTRTATSRSKPKRATTTRAGASRSATKKPATRRAPNPSFMRPVQPDHMLAVIVGDKPLPRTELTKKLWAYIRRKGLQDERQRRMINADDALRSVFGGKKQVSMFEMTRLVSDHIH